MSAAGVADSTIASILGEQAARGPGRQALLTEDVSVTYGELWERAVQFAVWLREHGVEDGECVALWLPNGAPWVIAKFAVAAAGGVVVPVSTRLTRHEAAYILEHADCRVIVAADRFLGRDYAAEAERIVAEVGRTSSVSVLATDPAVPRLPSGMQGASLPDVPADAPAIVQYTSGTTGRPKGCVLTHRAWTNNARFSAEIAGLENGDVVFTPSPFFHVFGSLTALMGTISAGACLVTTPTFSAATSATVIAGAQATHLVAVPTVWLDLMNASVAGQLLSIRSGRWAGDAFPRHFLERALDPNGLGWRLEGLYGLTEAPTLTQVRPDDPLWAKLTTVGRPTPGVEVKAVDPASGRDCGSGAVGEIVTRGYNRADSYLRDPGALDERMLGDWLRTGDLGTVGDDGYVRITGRLTDMVISGGANIYAREVEEVILDVEAVTLAAVLGKPDPRLGQVPVAWVAAPGASALQVETAIVRACKERLAPYKAPREIHVLSELPLTPTGKIHKAKLAEMTATDAGVS